jgi:hypothetical protein
MATLLACRNATDAPRYTGNANNEGNRCLFGFRHQIAPQGKSISLQRGVRCKLLWLGLNVLPHRPDRVQSPGGVFQVREDEDALGSRALRADAMESIACGWLSLAVVIGLMAQLMLGAWWVDSVTSLVLVWLLIKEGREAWKAEDDED